MHHSFVTIIALVATAAAKTIVITAGAGGLAFSPDTVTAAVGDVLEYHFVGNIHSAVQGDFSSPCAQSSTGFDSGPVTSSDVFQVTVKNTDPIWFFCGTPTHCQGGMAGVVNPPASGDSLAAYKAAAAGTSSTSTSGKAEGGTVVAAGSVSSSSSVVSKSTTAPTSTKSTPSESASTPSTSAPATSGTETGTGTGTGSASTKGSGSGAASGTAPAATPSPTGTGTGNGTVIATPTPTPASVGNSLGEMSGKLTLWVLALGLGFFVVMMA